ncbi:YDG domain-containing protein [Neorhodopirellula lusitana]
MTAGSASAQMPTGADVVAGQAAISQAAGVMNVDAATNHAIVNWDSFSVGAGNTANFNLPDASSSILNRVTTPSMPSTIAGTINSNGNVFLVNPSGIVVSGSGMVNTNGFTASTFDVTNQDFMNGGALAFTRGEGAGSIVNNGTIVTGSGGAHLIASDIANNGTIQSIGGNITLSSGGRVTLDNGVTYAQPSMATLESGISPTAGLIQNTGTIRATGAATSGGEVYLVNPNGKILHDGTIAASQTSHVVTDDSNDRLEANPTVGGHVQLEADEITLAADSTINASGTSGGGKVLVGGDWQGSGTMTQATTVTMDANATIDASATETGDGGTIVLWSDIFNTDSITSVAGTLLARAGDLLGNGGQIETSGHDLNIESTALVDAGFGGHWLLDPYNIVISALGGDVTGTSIEASLNAGTSVTLDTSTQTVGAEAGDIFVQDEIDSTGTGSLTLKADRDIFVGEHMVRLTGDGANLSLLSKRNIHDETDAGNIHLETGTGSLLLASDTDGSGGGTFDLRTSGTIDLLTGGGDITLGGGNELGTGYAQGYDASTSEALILDAGVGTALHSNGGDISLRGRSATATAANGHGAEGIALRGGTTIDSGTGGIYIEGIGQQSGTSDSNGQGLYFYGGGETTITSAKAASDAIVIVGDASASDSTKSFGIDFASNMSIHATGDGGGILIDAHAGAENTDMMFRSGTHDILANSGPITVQGNKPSGYLELESNTDLTIGSRSGTSVPTSTSDLKIEFDQYWFNDNRPNIATSGDVIWQSSGDSFGQNVSTEWFTWNADVDQTMSELTIGKSTNNSTVDFAIGDQHSASGALTVAGGVTAYGSKVTVTNDLTSTGTGDIFLQASGTANPSIDVAGDISKTGGDRSAITLKGAGRVHVSGLITATNTGGSDVVLWSDYDGGNQGGVSIMNNISTGGGHLWAGGSDTIAGSETWNGLTVGNGPSVGGDGSNHNALDLYGNLTSSGGDVLLWAGSGYNTGITGIGMSGDRTIDSGAGNVTLFADDVVGSVLTLNSTGLFTFKPNSTAFGGVGGELSFDGTIASDTFTGANDVDWLKFNNYSSLGGLTLGKDGSTSSIRVLDPVDVNGVIELYGNNITIDSGANLDSSGGDASANVVMDGSGDVVVQSAINSGGGVTIQGDTVTLDSSIAYTGDVSIISENSDLNFNGALTKTGTSDTDTLLKSSRHIVLNSGASVTTADGTQDVKLWADSDDSGDGINIVSSQTINTNGGDLTVGNGNTATINDTEVKVGGDLYVNGSVAQSLETGGGDIIINGETIVANSNGLTVDAGSGAITFGGVVNSGNTYQGVNSTQTWTNAVTAAASGTGDQTGDTYLATITSRLENAIAGISVDYLPSWLGGRRVTGIGTDDAWRWVTGPEGLQDDGQGLIYALQDSAGGVTSQNDLFNNWNPGEPNNWTGSEIGSLDTESESAHQFTGSAGNWNDLPTTSTTLDWYVKETNAVASPLTVTTTGSVNFGGGIGGSKALASLDVTGSSISVNGNAVATTGAQNFSSDLTVTSASTLQVDATALTVQGAIDFSAATGNVDITTPIDVLGDISIVSGNDLNLHGAVTRTGNADTSTLLKADRHVVMQEDADLTTTNGSQSIQFWADADNSGDGINTMFSDVIATSGGHVKFGNGETATVGGESVKVGGDVYLSSNNAQSIATDGGDITIDGETILANLNGVTLDSAGGDIALNGLLNSGNAYTYVDGPDGQANAWEWARTDAKDGTEGGDSLGDSYLVTITSRLENAIAGISAGYQGAWIGAYRADPAGSYAWTWADGPEQGQNFFTQSGSGGGSAQSGWYSNFGGGEPNGGLASNGERYGQFYGTEGLWNDLPASKSFDATQGSQYSVLGYVRETNLDPTSLTINAGLGSVTFAGAAGTSKALSALNVTAGGGIHINGGAINTTGIQTYNSPVVLGAHTHFSTIQNDILFHSTVDSDDVATPWNLTATITPSNVYHWVDWTTWDAATKTATGTITVGSEVITVTYHNPQGIYGIQTSGGTAYWTGRSGGSFSGESPYVSDNVANGPSTTDLIQLQYAGSQTLTFSESVENLAFSIMSMNGNGYGFDQDFTIESYSGLNGAGPGYFGAGTMTKAIVGDTFQLNDGGVNSASEGGNSEPHGTIRFANAFSELTWNSLSDETWNGFSVGVSGTSSTAGSVQFNGAVGSNAALGNISINAAVQTTANIAAASSFDVTGLANLGGDITTTGDQTFGSAITLAADLALTTTDAGDIQATSTIDGAHDLTIETDTTGDTTIAGNVGGNNTLANLTIDTHSLDANAISLATDAALDVTTRGASEIAGVISGTDTTLAKDGDGTLVLAATNTYTGSTTITGGKLSISGDANLGPAPSSPTESHLTLDGGTLLVTGNTTLNSNRGIELGDDDGAIEVATGTTTQYTGIIAGSGGLTKSGAGKLSLSGESTYTGATTIDGGIVETSNASALGDDSAVTLANVADTSLNLLSNLTIGSLAGGGSTGGNVSLGTSTLTTGDDGTSTNFAGNISGTGGLIKAGDGTFTASGLATYSGSTAVTGGIVFQNNTAPLTSGFTGTGTVTIEPTGTSFSSALTSNYSFANTLGGLTLGKSGNASDISVNTATIIDGDVAIHGGNVAINNTLQTTAGNTLKLGVLGNATQTTAITTDNLALQGTGNFTLDNVANSIGTLAGGQSGTLLSNVTLYNSDALTIGTVGSQNGIAASGLLNLATQSGDLTIAQNVSTTNATASAIMLNAGRTTAAGTATGGNLILSNSPSITVGTGGRATLFTGSIANSLGLTDLLTSGSGRFRYNSDESATNYSLALDTGLYGIYREQPSITVTAADASSTYGTAPTLTSTINSQNGDTVAQAFSVAPTITVGGDLSTSGNHIAGGHTLTASGGTSQLGYAIDGYSGGTLTVNQKTISVPIVVDNKVYDGTTTAQMNATASGVVAGDLVTIGGTAAFTDKNAGTNKTVNITGLNLTGTDAANYALASTSDTSSADITPLAINVSGLTGDDKVYDGTTLATLSGTATVAAIGVDDVEVNGSAIASFDNKNVGTSKSIIVNGLTLNGDDANNYSINQPTGLTADITPAPLTVTANNDAKFVTQDDPAGFAGASYTGFVAGESTTDLTGSLSIMRSKIGTDEFAGSYFNSLVASGLSSTNYDISFVPGDFTIVPADQLLVRFGNSSSNYGDILGLQLLSAKYMDDSNTVHTLTPTSAANGHYEFNDGVGGTAAFDVVLGGSSTSTSNHTNVGAFTLGMENIVETSGNFSNSLHIVGNHTVNRAAIDVSASGVTKSYDGNDLMVNLSLDQTGNIAGDSYTLHGQGNYASPNAGTGLSYTVGNLELSGTDANNYYLSGGSTYSAADGVITPKNVTITAPTATKVYDGNTNLVATTPQLQAFTTALGITGDSVASITLTYDDKNVGTDKTLTASNIAINDGNGGGNYNITFADDTSSSITRLGTVTWIGGTTGDWNDPANWVGGAVPDLANVANVIIPQGVTPTFDNNVNGPVEIDSLLGGNLQIDSGTLNVDGSLDVDTYTQNGGKVTAGTFTADDFAQNDGSIEVDGTFTVNNSFTQSTTGTIEATGDVDITQTSGDLTVNNLSGGNVKLDSETGGVNVNDLTATGSLDIDAAGDITQSSTGTITVGETTTLNAGGNIDLAGINNDFVGPIHATGNDINLVDGHGGLTLGNIDASRGFTATSTDGDLTQHPGTTVKVEGDTTVAANGNVILDNEGNLFTGIVNVLANNGIIRQSTGDLLLGNVQTTGDFTATANNGSVGQTPTSTIEVAGNSSFTAKTEISLPNTGNRLGQQTTVNAPLYELNSLDPLNLIRTGAALADSALSESVSETTNDTFTRPASASQSDSQSQADAGQSPNGWFERFKSFVTSLTTRDAANPVLNEPPQIQAEQTGPETYLRSQGPA